MSIRAAARIADVPHPTVQGWLSGKHFPTPALRPSFLLLLDELGLADAIPEDLWDEGWEHLRPTLRDGRAPYLGLRPFGVCDGAFFFGRAHEVRRLAEAVAEVRRTTGHGIVALVGPSGSGKSSLLAAGLIAGECTDGVLAGWRAELVLVSGLNEDRLAGADLIVVDQFEDAILRDPDERPALLARLGELAEEAVVLIALRSDAFAPAMQEPLLVDPLSHPVLLAPLTRADLRDIIVGPAETVGVAVDDDLVQVLLDELAPGPATATIALDVLPVLSNALLVTWAGGHGARLTLADYHASGGVATAVDALAEQVYASLDVEEQDATRVLFLRLLRVSADLVTREPLLLAGLDPRQRAGLDAFAAARMLTISGGIVRISHDALLDHWSRLHDWVEESRSDLDVLTKLRRAAQVWADSGREDDALIPVRRLAVFSPWLADADRRELLSAQEREFLAASEAHLTTLLEAEQANSMRLRRRGSLAIALAALATAFALFAGFLIAHGQVLQAQAVAARDDAQSRQVATAARLLRGTDPNLLTQMALVASRIADTEEGRSILLDATAVDAGSRWAGTPSAVVTLSADENLLVRAAGAGEVTLWRGEEIGASPGTTVAVDPLAGPLYAVALTRVGGRDLLAVGGESVRALWDVTGEPVHLADVESDGQTAFAAAFDADGATLALGTSAGEVQLWDVADPGHPVLSATVALDQPADTTVRPGVTSVVVGADRILYASGALGSINRWRLGGSPTPLPSLDASLATDEAPARPVMVQTMALSPDGTRLAAGLAARGVLRWQVSGEQVTPLEPLRGFGSYVNDVSFSADGTWLVTASSDQDVAVHDAATGEELRRVTMPALATGAVLSRWRPIAVGSDGMLRVWPLTSPAWRIGGSAVYNLATDGREDGWLAAGTFTDGTVLWRLGADAPVRMPTPVVTLADGDRQRGAAAVAPSGGYLVGASARGSVLSWPLSDEGAGEVRVTPTDLDNVAVTVVSPDSSLVAALEYTGARTALFAATADGVLTQVATLDSPRPQYAAFLDGGAVLAVAVAAKRVDLWSVADPSHPVLAGRIEGFSTWPTAVAADATGTLVAVGEDSGHVSVWNVADPAEPRRVRVYTQARSAVYSLAFRADGHQLVGAGGDNLVWGWDLASPSTEAQFALRGELDRPWDVRYLGDGARLAVGSNDGTVRVWLTDPDAARRALCAGRGEPMTSEEWDTNLNGVTSEDPC